MADITKTDLDALARKRRVKSIHKWFAVLQRIVNNPDSNRQGSIDQAMSKLSPRDL